MSRLFLFDGTAVAYRSHFAMMRSGLSTADGRPTGAVYGFTMALRRILREEKPDLVAVALDAKGPTFRHEKFAEYKATRERAPEEMIQQLEDIREVIKAHGIPLFEIPGYEADDVIGTLATRAAEAGHEVRIVTGDKDMMQLVSEHVKLHNIFKPGVDLVIEGPAEVEAKFGTTPDHVIDVLAIMGDTSDNIPGVKGIGEKGAQKLIQEFGSVPALLERLDEVKGKTKEKLEADRAMLELSLELVTIDTDVPLDPGFESIHPATPDVNALRDLFQGLDFRSLMDEVAASVDSDGPGEREDVIVETREALETMIAELTEAGTFAWDTETTGLKSLEVDLVGMSFCAEGGRAFYVPFNTKEPILEGGTAALLDALRPLMTDPELYRIGQNEKYDALVMGAHGIFVPPPYFDTMVASFTIHGSARRHNLDDMALVELGMTKIPTSQLLGKGKNQVTMAEIPIDEVAEYACEDADATFRLYERFSKDLEETDNEKLFHELEMPLVRVLTKMERRGIRLDTAAIKALDKELMKEIDSAEEDVKRLAGEPGLKVNSPKALGLVLFEKLRIQDEAGVKRVKKTKTGYSTDQATLNENYGDVEIVKRLLEYREVMKLKNTYVDALPTFVNPKTGRIHCSFSQTVAATGRLSSSDPNLQNIPVRTERGRKLRAAFVPREPDEHGEWVLLAADYSQVELRILAHLSGDEKLAEAFREGRDIHASTASLVFGVAQEDVDRTMRSQAKAINFGLLYGMGPQRLARETGLTVPEAKDFIERYFEAFPKVRGWIDGVLEGARETGHVETLMGRRRPMPDVNSTNQRVRAAAENAAVNTPVQGSAADIIKKAMIDLDQRLDASDLQAQLLLQVHDELVLEVPVSELEATTKMVKDAMENAVALDVPLNVDFGHGKNWLEAH
ncbi:DNA polymerase I [Planctomycetes bacterium Poly30]|uniref:DNA polymerase I n=1 Tax=Saltatorellus ferox TaxID=2528018 RepID=A0A518EVH7_9BACT|nr:DNA polymerase I [Planctomycetes bacterium Poly30]